jgi:hypothetical protein
MYINEIDSNSYFLDWDSSNNTQLIGITSFVTSSEVYNTYALDCSLNVYEIYVSTPNDPPTTLYYVGDTSWSEGSIICTFTGLNKKPVTEFTTIEGELELQKLLLGDYIDDTIIKTFKKLRTKNYIRVYNITDKTRSTGARRQKGISFITPMKDKELKIRLGFVTKFIFNFLL